MIANFSDLYPVWYKKVCECFANSIILSIFASRNA